MLIRNGLVEESRREANAGNKRPDCENQPQDDPDKIPIIDPLARWLNDKLGDPFKGPFWDNVREWQTEFERGPRPSSGWGPTQAQSPCQFL
jgi:hypothetical protein